MFWARPTAGVAPLPLAAFPRGDRPPPLRCVSWWGPPAATALCFGQGLRWRVRRGVHTGVCRGAGVRGLPPAARRLAVFPPPLSCVLGKAYCGGCPPPPRCVLGKAYCGDRPPPPRCVSPAACKAYCGGCVGAATRRLAAFPRGDRPPPLSCVSPAPSLCFGQGLLRGLPPAPSLMFWARPTVGVVRAAGAVVPRPLAVFWARPTAGVVRAAGAVVPRPLAYVLGKACGGDRPPPLRCVSWWGPPAA